jgi:hypothetical protein
MKIFKNILPIAMLFFVNFVIAKSRGAAAPARPQAVVQQPPVPQSIAKQTIQPPVMQEKSYKDMVNFIKKSPNAWDSRHSKLDNNFINIIIKKANQLNLDNAQLESLLQTARDMHGVFSGNQNQDIAILSTIEGQIETAIKQR